MHPSLSHHCSTALRCQRCYYRRHGDICHDSGAGNGRRKRSSLHPIRHDCKVKVSITPRVDGQLQDCYVDECVDKSDFHLNTNNDNMHVYNAVYSRQPKFHYSDFLPCDVCNKPVTSPITHILLHTFPWQVHLPCSLEHACYNFVSYLLFQTILTCGDGLKPWNFLWSPCHPISWYGFTTFHDRSPTAWDIAIPCVTEMCQGYRCNGIWV